MKAKKALFIVFSALLLVVMAVVLELNKNTVWGFVLLAVIAAGFYVAHRFIILKKNKWYLKLPLWLALIALYTGILALTYPPVRAIRAVSVDTPVYTELVAVTEGQVQGVQSEDGTVEIFAGVPYAKPPVDELRWCEPQDPDPYEGVLRADTFAPMSMQPVNLPIYNSLARIIGYHDYQISLDDNFVAPVSEDSLYLNIWRPAEQGEDRPVIVYIHGGSLQTGQPWYEDYSGQGLAQQGVIVVNMGYRLGIFGYLADEQLAAESPHHTTGNYGLLDQIKALEWVKANIAAFGGDPDNVTLAGESAGAASVSALCTSPLSRGLFRRVILESSTVASVSPPHSFRLLDDALAAGDDTMARFGCSSVDELRALPAEQLVNEAYVHHHITVDGYALEETPYESYRKGVHNEEAILHGYNDEESAAFILFDGATLNNYEDKMFEGFGDDAESLLALYPASTDAEAAACWAEVYGAHFFDYPHYCLNRLAVENEIPCYEYVFSKSNGRLGDWHSGELVYCFGNIPDDSSLYDDRDRALSREMSAYWVNFARTGDPNGDSLPRWDENTTSSRVMRFGDSTAMGDEDEHPLFELFDRIAGWHTATP